MRDTQQSEAPSVPLRKIHKYYVNIKHYKKYKNPICKNDKNESLPQPIKSLSSSSYQLIEDCVTYCIVSDVIVCAKSSRIALE